MHIKIYLTIMCKQSKLIIGKIKKKFKDIPIKSFLKFKFCHRVKTQKKTIVTNFNKNLSKKFE
jgi:hypothetical protein